MPGEQPLYKTTIVIWSRKDPSHQKLTLSEVAEAAEDGLMYCSIRKTERVEEPSKDKSWDGTDFFDED